MEEEAIRTCEIAGDENKGRIYYCQSWPDETREFEGAIGMVDAEMEIG